MPMIDGNTPALRALEAAQDRDEKLAPTKADLMDAAQDAIKRSETLRAILNDEDLAGPLATIFRELDASIGEAAEQMGRVRMPATDAIRQAAAQMERIACNWMLSKYEEEGLP